MNVSSKLKLSYKPKLKWSFRNPFGALRWKHHSGNPTGLTLNQVNQPHKSIGLKKTRPADLKVLHPPIELEVPEKAVPPRLTHQPKIAEHLKEAAAMGLNQNGYALIPIKEIKPSLTEAKKLKGELADLPFDTPKQINVPRDYPIQAVSSQFAIERLDSGFKIIPVDPEKGEDFQFEELFEPRPVLLDTLYKKFEILLHSPIFSPYPMFRASAILTRNFGLDMIDHQDDSYTISALSTLWMNRLRGINDIKKYPPFGTPNNTIESATDWQLKLLNNQWGGVYHNVRNIEAEGSSTMPKFRVIMVCGIKGVSEDRQHLPFGRYTPLDLKRVSDYWVKDPI